MSTLSTEFRTRWAAHDVRVHHGGVKSFNHPDAGPLELTYQPLDLPLSTSEAHSLTIHTAEPGSPDEDRLKLLAGLAATPAPPATTFRRHPDRPPGQGSRHQRLVSVTAPGPPAAHPTAPPPCLHDLPSPRARRGIP
ncbi:MmyB family transcriptional regulator [Streptomyces mexicanus]|uniref:MmyB family transcriptional regulator n=1 Tax=Streptomyces mexicanus TaxID=178566 RepID=UPI0036619E26